jgi:hypothetical protein
MTLFASFDTTVDAEKAAAAILDRGARQEDLSIVAHYQDPSAVEIRDGGETQAEGVAKHGLTTTTGADAAMGAAKGLSFGMGLGILGAIATLFVPGVGLVVGGGALASIIASTAAAGAATGGVVGFLKDQGMGDEVAATYHARVAAGGAVLSLQVPTGNITEIEAESLLVKYGAVGVFTSYPTTTVDIAPLPVAAPNVVPGDSLEMAIAGSVRPVGSEVPVGAVTPTRSDPISGMAIEGYVEDPVSGVRRAVRFDEGRAYYVA